MDEPALAAASEAVAINVDYEADTSLGENDDLQGGHIPPELSDDKMTGKAMDDHSKRTGNTIRRMALRMLLQHIHIPCASRNQFLIITIDSQSQVLISLIRRLRPCRQSSSRRSSRRCASAARATRSSRAATLSSPLSPTSSPTTSAPCCTTCTRSVDHWCDGSRRPSSSTRRRPARTCLPGSAAM